ncbi:serine hydrolase domain-containing protein [Rhizobium grahamii]|uniref:Beta-lactamase n=1 Tax=Rhizobium grahamii CCGE 502 TaxID=990285 RepID=S3IFE5_9HYPH|nr:serine hydrolase [Rhizobium grahamii]EPE97713.1 beta-lactamase [Rhizobium grahamii CCGE 502]
MRFVLRVVKSLALLLVVIVAMGGAWLYVNPPELLRVGDGYAAKIVCSNVFLAGRDPEQVLYEDVQAPGNPLLRLVRVAVDRQEKRVTARILGLFAPGYAIYRGALGCSSVPDGDFVAAARAVPDGPEAQSSPNEAIWPEGNAVADVHDSGVDALLADKDLLGPAMRAVVVVHNGRIIAERYGDGFSPTTPLTGWSMTKTVNAAIVGRLMLDNRITFDDIALLPQWQGGDHSTIKLSDLMGMQSGLAFNESYGTVADVTRMLYLDADMTALPASLPLEASPGERFNYSSGTSVLISKIWMDRIGNMQTALAYPKMALFDPIGMSSAVLEVDARGTFAGSSYLYATARDWARFGQFLLQDGVWNGERLLPERFMTAMRTPTASSGGKYTKAQAWLAAPGGDSSTTAGLPEDTFWMEGHDGQSVAIVPSAKLVVVRLGLTPSWLRYKPQMLVKEILAALPGSDQ